MSDAIALRLTTLSIPLYGFSETAVNVRYLLQVVMLSIPLYGFKSNRSNGIIVHKSIDFQFHCMDSELYEALYGSRDIELSIPLYGFRARR